MHKERESDERSERRRRGVWERALCGPRTFRTRICRANPGGDLTLVLCMCRVGQPKRAWPIFAGHFGPNNFNDFKRHAKPLRKFQ